MSIQVVCRCGQAFAADARFAGQTISCPTCGGPLIVSDARSRTAPNPAGAAAAAAMPESSSSGLLTTLAIGTSVLAVVVIVAMLAHVLWSAQRQAAAVRPPVNRTPTPSVTPPLSGAAPVERGPAQSAGFAPSLQENAPPAADPVAPAIAPGLPRAAPPQGVEESGERHSSPKASARPDRPTAEPASNGPPVPLAAVGAANDGPAFVVLRSGPGEQPKTPAQRLARDLLSGPTNPDMKRAIESLPKRPEQSKLLVKPGVVRPAPMGGGFIFQFEPYRERGDADYVEFWFPSEPRLAMDSDFGMTVSWGLPSQGHLYIAIFTDDGLPPWYETVRDKVNSRQHYPFTVSRVMHPQFDSLQFQLERPEIEQIVRWCRRDEFRIRMTVTGPPGFIHSAEAKQFLNSLSWFPGSDPPRMAVANAQPDAALPPGRAERRTTSPEKVRIIKRLVGAPGEAVPVEMGMDAAAQAEALTEAIWSQAIFDSGNSDSVREVPSGHGVIIRQENSRNGSGTAVEIWMPAVDRSHESLGEIASGTRHNTLVSVAGEPEKGELKLKVYRFLEKTDLAAQVEWRKKWFDALHQARGRQDEYTLSELNVAGFKGIEARFERPQIEYVSRVIQQGDFLVILEVHGPKRFSNTPDAQRFLKSPWFVSLPKNE